MCLLYPETFLANGYESSDASLDLEVSYTFCQLMGFTENLNLIFHCHTFKSPLELCISFCIKHSHYIVLIYYVMVIEIAVYELCEKKSISL